MGQDLIPFAFDDNLVRALTLHDEPWFVGKDVCGVLDITKHHQALDRLDEDERGTYTIGTPSGEQNMIIISEAGVFRLVFTSRKPEAERFKRWLAHEVLPALRRTGKFDMGARDEPAINEEPIATLNVKLAMIREARMIFGPAKARLLWTALGLPALPVIDIQGEPLDSDAMACLNHILAHRLQRDDEPPAEGGQPFCRTMTLAQLIERAIDGEDDAIWDLRRYGIRVEEDESGPRFWIASYCEALRDVVFKNTQWADTHHLALRRLHAARPTEVFHTKNYKVEGQTTRGYSFPESYLEPVLRQPPPN